VILRIIAYRDNFEKFCNSQDCKIQENIEYQCLTNMEGYNMKNVTDFKDLSREIGLEKHLNILIG